MTGQKVLAALGSCLLQLVLTQDAGAYTLLLPDAAAGSCESMALPYTALADHFTGPACIQMALNTCPDTTQRACHTQANLYSKVLLHNSEPLDWFSDPDGVEGTLEDTSLSPCGNWVVFSNTDKSIVLGKLLYYMRTQRYFTPVMIGTGEHWVNVIGYETDIEPPFSGAVTLQNIFFYDPLPASPSLGWVSGDTWLGVMAGATGYWAAPLDKAGSSWHGHYVAVIEPPRSRVVVRIPRWRPRDRILPPEVVLRSVHEWYASIRERQLARGPFEILLEDLEIRRPVLVKAENPYYLVRFSTDRLVAVFNAFDGSFEELRLFEKPQKGAIPQQEVTPRLREKLRHRGLRLAEAGRPELVYRPEVSRVGRVAPHWEVTAEILDRNGHRHKAVVRIGPGGEIVGGLEELPRHRPDRPRIRVHEGAR